MLSKLLVYVAKKHKDRMAVCLRKLGVYVGQDIFLLTLRQHGELSQKELKEILRLEFATINKIAGRLQVQGLVAKTKNPEDMRASIISLTKKGEETIEKIQACWDKLEVEFFDALNEEEKSQLNRLLLKLNQ